MTDSAIGLVGEMVAAGEWPEPSLLEAIFAQGQEAVPPLLDVLRRDAVGWPEEAPLCHAIGLLGMIRAPETIPALMDVFRRFDNETLEGLPDALSAFGAAIVEPLLAITEDSTLDWYSRALATATAINASSTDSEARARVTETLRQLLAGYAHRAEELTIAEIDMASSLVVDLSHLADPQGREVIAAAQAAGISRMMNENDVERCYREGGWKRKDDSESWLSGYRGEYQRHQDEARRPRQPTPHLLRPISATPAPVPHMPALNPSRVERRIGRNDPCWCGSGKKFKNCHRLQAKK